MAVKETAEEYFFPNSENFIDEDEEKEKAASKRQRQRDVSRSHNNPNRTAEEDAKEGRRKRTQHERSGRGRPAIDQEGGRRREGGRSVSRTRYEGNDRNGDRAVDTRSNRSRNDRRYSSSSSYDDRRRSKNNSRNNNKRGDYDDDDEEFDYDEAEARAVVA